MSLLSSLFATAKTALDTTNGGIRNIASAAGTTTDGLRAAGNVFSKKMNAWEERVTSSIENDLKADKESDAAQAINNLIAAKRAKLAALEELAEVEAQAKAKGIDLNADPFASIKKQSLAAPLLSRRTRPHKGVQF